MRIVEAWRTLFLKKTPTLIPTEPAMAKTQDGEKLNAPTLIPTEPAMAKTQDGEKLNAEEVVLIKQGKCPDCGGEDWLAGPTAGINQNWACANPKCGSRFNLCSLSAALSERISEPQPLGRSEEPK